MLKTMTLLRRLPILLHHRSFHRRPALIFRRRKSRRFPTNLRQPIPFLSDIKESRSPTEALHLFHRYQEIGFRHHYPSYSALAYRLARSGDFETLDSLLLHIRETGVPCKERMFTAIIDHYGKSSLPDRALDLFHSMPSFNSTRSRQSLNTLMNSMVDNDRLPVALSLLSLCKTLGFCPNSVSYNVLIKGYLRQNDWDSARKMFDEMLMMKVEPTTVTYNSFLGFLSRGGKVKEARKLVEEMTEKGKMPNPVTYALLMEGLCLAGEYREAEKVMFDMDYRGCRPEAVNFAVLVEDLGRRGKIEEAMEMMRKMKRRRGAKVDIRIHNILIKYLCREGRVVEAERELTEVKVGGKLELNGASYGMVVDGFCGRGDTEKGMRVMRRMVAAGHRPRADTYVRMASELFRRTKSEEEDVLFLFEEMKKDAVGLPLEVWEGFIRGRCDGLDDLIDSLI